MKSKRPRERSRSQGALEGLLRTLAFTLSKWETPWRVLNSDEAFDLDFDMITLVSLLRRK